MLVWSGSYSPDLSAAMMVSTSAVVISAFTLGSIGVVFGDIGTSPLYAFREAVTHAANGEEVTVGIGRFGPFAKRGSTYASLTKEDTLTPADWVPQAYALHNSYYALHEWLGIAWFELVKVFRPAP